MTRLSHDWYERDLPDNVTLGEGSWLYSAFAFRHCRSQRPHGVRIGRESGIYDGTTFDLGIAGEVVIGDYCTIVGAIICGNLRVEVQDFTFIAHEVVITDSPWSVPPDVGTCRSEAKPPLIVLGANCWIGARAILLPGARIGQDAIVGAGAVIDCLVPDGAMAVGNPARLIERQGSVSPRRTLGGAADDR